VPKTRAVLGLMLAVGFAANSFSWFSLSRCSHNLRLVDEGGLAPFLSPVFSVFPLLEAAVAYGLEALAKIALPLTAR